MIVMSSEQFLTIVNGRFIIDPITGCKLFTGSISDTGYGSLAINGKPHNIHRVAAFVYLGLDLEDKTQFALHKENCPNKHCFNHEHLYIGTATDNQQDRIRQGRHNNINKTHCPKGHEYNEENTYISKQGTRKCRECNRLRYYGL